jgi:predicted secreted hydrolase
MKQRPIKLPEDTKPHDTIIEWWYFNGHLADAKGARYSFMDCLFRADADKVNIPYLKNIFSRSVSGKYVAFAHSTLANITKKTSEREIQNISLFSRDSFTRPLFYVNYIDPIATAKGFLVNEMAEIKPGIFHVKTRWIDLVMESKRKPLLEGGQGFITMRGRESFYYSLTDLTTTGAIRVGEEWVPVTGRSWMDHQWADVAYAKDKWTWFSMRLDDGTVLMCVEYDDGKGKDYLVDILDSNGRAAHYRHAVFTQGKERWKSRMTKTEYPLSWTITVPQANLTLTTSAPLPNQEMIFGSINYWEGPISVAATVGGKRRKGVGFMELSGYPSNYNFLLLAGKKVNKKLQEELSTRVKDFFK